MTDFILKYFPDLSEKQKHQFELLMQLYPQWNAKINVVSRKDIENLEINHILHSLAIAKFISFTPGSKVMDLGTGGGLPGIPLAVMCPDTRFLLVDRTGKKITVASEIAKALDLKNVECRQADASEIKDQFDFVVSRAVMPQQDLMKISRRLISKQQKNGYPNGLITLKGGDLTDEMKGLEKRSLITPINQYFKEPFFDTKSIVYTELLS